MEKYEKPFQLSKSLGGREFIYDKNKNPFLRITRKLKPYAIKILRGLNEEASK